VTRAESLRRLAIWGVVVAIATAVLYLPTLSGSPWSWHIAEAPRLALVLVAYGAGLLTAHWWWPTTARWPELERAVARQGAWHTRKGRPLTREEQDLLAMRVHDLYLLVRPHVLERARRES
jgi:hypothetical protein